MYILSTTFEDCVNEFDFVNDWVDTICDKIIKKKKEDCDISVFYNYGYFIPKGGSNIQTDGMLFNDRLSYELSKLRVYLIVKIDDFIMNNKMYKMFIPNMVRALVTEITKYKMAVEFEEYKNQLVKDSIPDYDNTIISIEIVIDGLKNEMKSLDIDSILDKIAKEGVDSLDDEERDFLDKKSKE